MGTDKKNYVVDVQQCLFLISEKIMSDLRLLILYRIRHDTDVNIKANFNIRLSQYNIVESLQSHFILTMSHWSSGLPVCFPSQGTQIQILRGVLM